MPKPVKGTSLITRWTVLQGPRRYDLPTIVMGAPTQIVPEGVVLAVGERERPIRADIIVLATGVTPRNSLYEELRGRVEELHLVGDAKEPRKTYDAMHEGFEVGMQLQTRRLRIGVAFSTMSARRGAASEKERRT